MYLDAYQGRVVASTAGLAAGFVGFCSAHLVDLDVYQDRAAASVAKVVLAVVVLGGWLRAFLRDPGGYVSKSCCATTQKVTQNQQKMHQHGQFECFTAVLELL